jgi:hypothetical protein
MDFDGAFLFGLAALQILYIIYVYVKSNRKINYDNITDNSSTNHNNIDDYSSDNYYYNNDDYYDNSYHQDDYNWISDVGFSHCDGNIYHID